MHDPHANPRPLKDRINNLAGWATIISALVPLVTRVPGTGGSRLFDGKTILSLIFLFVVIVLRDGPRQPYPVALWAVGILTGLLILHRIRHRQLTARGDAVHSLYTGTPLIPGPEMFVKRLVEPALIIGLGWLLADFSPGLSLYCKVVGVCHFIAVNYSLAAEEAIIRAMRDAQIEQQHYARQMRKGVE